MSRYRPPQPQGSFYITPEGAQALREELDTLWRHRRPAVTRALAEAAAEGDRSENAEYIYRKKELREIDRRIRHLRRRLDVVRVVDRLPDDRTRIFFGAWFAIVSIDGDDHIQAREHRLVGPDESGLDAAYTSIESPLGRAVCGRSTGDRITVQTPAGELNFRIERVRYDDRQMSEEAADFGLVSGR